MFQILNEWVLTEKLRLKEWRREEVTEFVTGPVRHTVVTEKESYVLNTVGVRVPTSGPVTVVVSVLSPTPNTFLRTRSKKGLSSEP